MSLQQIKINIEEILEKLESLNENLLEKSEIQNLKEYLLKWYPVINSKQYEDLKNYVPNKNIATVSTLTSNILTQLQNITILTLNAYYNQNLQQYFNNINSYIDLMKAEFLQFFIFTSSESAIRNFLDISEDKKKIRDFNKKVEGLKTKELKDIESAYTALMNEKDGMKQQIEKGYSEIKAKYDKLFIEKHNIGAGSDGQEKVVNGEIGKIDYILKALEESNKEMNKYKIQMMNFINNDKYVVNNEECAGLNKMISKYQEILDNIKDEIGAMKLENTKALGDKTSVLMQKTFKDEAFKNSVGSWFMFILQMVAVGLFFFYNINLHSKVSQNINIFSPESIMLRVIFSAPFILIFWLCNKKHDIYSILLAEYKHKLSAVNAMIGWKARYLVNEDNFTENMKEEYAKFFEKTFEEINKNSADKINKLYLKNQIDLKDVFNFLKNSSDKGKNN